MAAIYRKVSVRTWADEKFRNLSKPKPCGQFLWMHLLTGPHSGPIPGIICSGEMALTESLEWPIDGFRKAFGELIDANMVIADLKNRLIFIPNAIKHNPPESPNVVISWHTYWDLVPECELKNIAYETIHSSLNELGNAFSRAWHTTSVRHRNYKISPETMKLVKDRDMSLCRYCGKDVNWTNRRGLSGGTYDHIDPTGPGTEDNVVTSCRSCNSQKGFRTPQQAGFVLLQIGTRSDLNRTQIGSANQEQEQEQEQELRPEEGLTKKPGEEPRHWIYRSWLLYLRRKPNSADDEQPFDELLRRGLSPDTIEAEIKNPARDRTEAIWEFVKRLNKMPIQKPRIAETPQSIAEFNRRQLEAIRAG